MKLVAAAKIFLILAMPLLIFLLALKFTVFSDSFYQEKFSEYGVRQDIPKADFIHQRVMGFLKEETSELPSDFNEREKRHLWDVRKIARISNYLLYALLVLFAGLSAVLAFILKDRRDILGFIGKALLFGGLLTILLAVSLLAMIYSDFSSSFESFHGLFFQKGTYMFDPQKEIIVRIYPQELFMDLGILISKRVIAASAVAALSGALLKFLNSKNKKNK